MLHLLHRPVAGAQVRLEHAPEQLEQDLEADLCDGRVVAALAQLVADEGVLGPGELVKAEDDAGLAQLGPDQVTSGVGHVRVLDAEDHGHLAAAAFGQPREPVERVGGVWGGRRAGGVWARMRAQGARVHVGCEVVYAG